MDSKALLLKLLGLFQSLGLQGTYLLIFGVLLGCGLGVPIPEDITLISAGILSSQGAITIPGALIAGFIGVLSGDAILFFLGRKFGPRVYQWPGFRRLFTPERVTKAEVRIRKNAKVICFAARFMPGLRAPIYLTSGTLGVHPLVFFGADGLAALISVPIWIFVGNWFGNNLDYLLSLAKKINGVVIGGVLLGIVGFLIYKKVKKAKA